MTLRRGQFVGRWPIFSLSMAVLIGGAGMADVAAAGTALPSGGHVADGAATITASGSTETIDQTSAKAVIDWSSFSLGRGGHVVFDNGSGATLNEVSGGSPAEIKGLLSGTGSIYVIDPAGVVIGKSGVIRMGGGFVAATLDPGTDQFLDKGLLTFSGASRASVVNLGRIGSLGGDVALIGATVRNSGRITATNGDVGLAAGSEVVVQDRLLDDGKFSVVVGGRGTSVTNTGLIRAAEAELRANGGNVYALAGNTGSAIEATGVAANDGKVFLVAEGGETIARGLITAQTASGAGGQVETSGSNVDFTGVHIAAGDWLVDPVNLTVNAAAAATISANLATTSVTLQTTASGASGPGTQSPGAGDIDILAPISWSSANTLTLDAYHGISILAPITVAGSGHVDLDTDDGGTGGSLDFGLGSQGFAGSIQFTGPEPAGQSGFHNPHDMLLTINGVGYILIYSLSELQDLNKKQNLSGDFALARSIDGTGFTGFVPIGGNEQADFTGAFEGLGNTISNLTIVSTSAGPPLSALGFTTDGVAGLFGTAGPGSVIRDLALSDVNVTASGGKDVGTLVGADEGGTLANISTSGLIQVSDNTAGVVSDVGGLAGTLLLGATASNVNSSSTVTGGAGTADGGLVGGISSGAALTNSSATGNVTGSGDVGGLVGVVFGYDNSAATISDPVTIANSFATGNVTSNGVGSAVGGFAGLVENSQIATAYATGNVTSSGAGSSVGGFLGTIENGQVSGAYATGSVTQTAAGANGFDFAGGFAGVIVASSSVSDSYATGSVTQTVGGSAGFDDLLGGFAGDIDQNSTVTQSYSSGAVSGLSSNGAGTFTLAGGFAGYDGGSITDAYSLSSVTIGGSGNNLEGGFVGDLAGSVSQVYASGAVAGPDATGGLAGFLAGGTLEDSYWDEGTTGQTNAFCCGSGTVINMTGIGGSTGLSPYAASTYANFDLNNVWYIVDGYMRPILRSEYSTTITNGHQLELMSLDPTANYTLANNIDLSGISNPSNIWIPDIGFVPIGFSPTTANAGATAFTGTFNGDGHSIDNMVITIGGAFDLGLFSVIGQGGLVENLNLVGGGVTASGATGDGTTVSGAGMLAGENDGTVSNVSASGDVQGPQDAGGLVGDNFGAITGSSASGEVNAGVNGGGLAGTNFGAISSSSASGDVGGPGSNYGGLVGLLSGGSIVNASAGGSVTGASLVGGLVGVMNGGSISQGSATGAVDATGNDVGGLVGGQGGGSISDSSASGSVTSTGSAVGGLVGSDLGPSSIDGSTASGAVNGGDETGGLVGFDSGGSITNSSASGAVIGGNFTGGLVGELNGAGNVVTGDSASGDVTGIASVGGLIGEADDSGLGLTNVHASGSVTGAQSVGGLVGVSQAQISNAYATGAVVADANLGGTGTQAGGLVGWQMSTGTITASYATGAVSAWNVGGGLVGRNDSLISQSFATGSVTATCPIFECGGNMGGLVGNNGQENVGSVDLNAIIEDSYATGAVTAFGNSGGLVGINSGQIVNAYATGLVTCSPNACGGVAGSNNDAGVVTNAYWDTQTTGLTIGVAAGTTGGSITGGGGLTTSQLKSGLPAGFSPSVWKITPGVTFPLLQWQGP